jgi:flavin-binding protein dodecin
MAWIYSRSLLEGFMADHVYKKLELVGSSTRSIDDAIKTAISKTDESVNNMRWFEVQQIRGEIADGNVAHFQVTVKVGFTIEN